MGITKYSKNPIITKDNVPFKVNSIFNPGAVKINNKYLLLCRVELPIGRSSLVVAESTDGYNFIVSDKPALRPEDHKEHFDYVDWGVEDARITRIENKFYITYTGYSKHQPLVMLAETEDFSKFNIIGPISEPSNKDCSLFPEKIGGYYWKVDRPTAESRRDIWISRSPDLVHWGNFRILQTPVQGSWEQDKIGSSSNPVKTKDGWLMLYHGVRSFGIGSIYRIGVVLLDPEKPWIIKGKSRDPIISPELNYERDGDVYNVVFANGWIVEDDGKIKIYYSGADTNICLAETTVDYLISVCK